MEYQVKSYGTVQRIRSPGLWGIESDSDKSYFQEVATEQLAELRGILAEMGFTAKQLDAAFKSPQTIEA